MWLELSGELFFFGNGGVVAVTEIRDNAFLSNKTIYQTELLFSSGKSVRVKETTGEISSKLSGRGPLKCTDCSC